MKNRSKALLHIGFRGLERIRIIISYTNSIYQGEAHEKVPESNVYLHRL